MRPYHLNHILIMFIKLMIKIKINGKEFFAEEGETVRLVALRNGIDIPGLCDHPDFKPKANCRLCYVEIKGQRNQHDRVLP